MLKEGEEIWPEVQEELTRSLATMRVDYEMHIKNLDNSNNPLLNKRRKRDSGRNPVTTTGESSNNYITKF